MPQGDLAHSPEPPPAPRVSGPREEAMWLGVARPAGPCGGGALGQVWFRAVPILLLLSQVSLGKWLGLAGPPLSHLCQGWARFLPVAVGTGSSGAVGSRRRPSWQQTCLGVGF